MASAALFGIYLSAVARLRQAMDATNILMWSSLVGCIFILPLLLTNQEHVFPVSWQGWASVVVLSAIQILGQGLIIYSMRTISISIIALFVVLDPVLTVFEAWLIFSEQLSLMSWISCLVCLAGVYLCLMSQSAQTQTS